MGGGGKSVETSFNHQKKTYSAQHSSDSLAKEMLETNWKNKKPTNTKQLLPKPMLSEFNRESQNKSRFYEVSRTMIHGYL